MGGGSNGELLLCVMKSTGGADWPILAMCILLVSAGSDGLCSGVIRQCENRRPHQPCGLSACWSLVGRR